MCMCMYYMYMYTLLKYLHTCTRTWKSDYLRCVVLLCFVVCMALLASFLLHLSLICTYMYYMCYMYTCMCHPVHVSMHSVGWAGVPGGRGILHPAGACEPLAGSQDRAAQHQHDGTERPESQGTATCSRLVL